MTMVMESAAPVGEVGALAELLRGRRVVALAGAGCSTESGIPDYRGPEGKQKVRRPIQYREFMGSPEARVRYWARSTALINQWAVKVPGGVVGVEFRGNAECGEDTILSGPADLVARGIIGSE